jgi:hypothetical protein
MAASDPRKAEEARQRRAALKKQVRHPYITGQELKGPEPVPVPASVPAPAKKVPPA